MKAHITKVTVLCLVVLLLVSGCTAGPVTSPPSVTAAAASTPTVMPTPTEKPTPSPTPVDTPTPVPTPVTFNEETFMQFFQFGMSSSEVRDELDNMGISYTYSTFVTEGFSPQGFLSVNTNFAEFQLNDQDQLYSINVYVCTTAKGLKKGSFADKIEQLYGQADELFIDQSLLNTKEYVYHMNGYLFSIVVKKHDTENFTVDGWKVFINTYNEPNVLTNPGEPITDYSTDESIKFNEDDFKTYFHFGMEREDVIQKLNDLGVRIALESYIDWDDGGWIIFTDHIEFDFLNESDTLDAIQVAGWDTAKGLKSGDSIEILYQLYGEPEEQDENFYMYKMNGYWFNVILTDGVVDSWSIS